MEPHVEHHPYYSAKVLSEKLRYLISHPVKNAFHDFSASDCSELKKWGIVNDQLEPQQWIL
jgi:hypothetical protein